MDVEVYSPGLLCCSVCAPEDMSPEDVVKRVNEIHPCGTENGWAISTDETFNGGAKNGGISVCHRGVTRHWLLDA